ncbi:hypothetical protein E2542_SST15910 [Spatholobus suberectus]|nr:hypothetical protein E2542_SST15910 [Spatholobus suberectus]
MNRTGEMQKEYYQTSRQPLFLKGSALPLASPNAGALKLKRIGIKYYSCLVKSNQSNITQSSY